MQLPSAVTLVEVGPRDGFQSIKPWIDTADKLAIIRALLDAGVDAMEAVSFISPKAIPQMQDAGAVVAGLRGEADMDRLFALAGNKKGADQAWAAGVRNLTLVISASEAHNRSNVRRTPAESLSVLADIRREHPALHVKLSVATAFGCPFRGEVSDEEVFFVVDGALEQGVRDICLCDTIGVASPLLVERRLGQLLDRYAGRGVGWSLHLHNTRGLAAANTCAALGLGIDRFETAVAGLGGCPFAPGASGNMATEDLVYLLRDMGIPVRADLQKLIAVSELVARKLKVCSDSKINAVTIHKVFPRPGEETL